MRELTKKGDPVLRIELPEIVVRMLKESARKNKRRFQDEFIKKMAVTIRNEETYSSSFEKFLPDLQNIYQN